MRFAREMDCETIQVSLASPYPGTELFRLGYRTVSWRSIRCSTNPVTRGARCNIRDSPRRDLWLSRALLPQFLFSAQVHLQVDA